MSVRESQTFGKTRAMFEGYGGPISIDQTDACGIDPTLEECCEREIESNRKQAAVEVALRRHDRIALAERRRRNIMKDLSFGDGCRCCYDNNDGGEYRALIELRSELLALKQQEENNSGNDNHNDEEEEKSKHGSDDGSSDSDSDSDDDSEFDYLLDEDLPGGDDFGNGEMSSELKLLQQERMEELQLSAMIRESAMQHGFGVHRQFHPQRVLYAAGLGLSGANGSGGGVGGYSNSSFSFGKDRRSSTSAAAIPPAAVIHLHEDTLLSASLDICLEEMALNTYRGTKFVRSYGRSTVTFNRQLVEKVLPKLNIDTSLPALIAVKNGDVVAMCENLSLFVNGIHSSDNDKVEPRAVEEWLDRAGVLLQEVPIVYEDYCRIRPEEDALLENMMMEKAKLTEAAAAIKEEQIYQCGVPGCRKEFHHEHIGVKNEYQDGLILCQEISTGTEV